MIRIMENKIDIKIPSDKLKIYINDTLHLSINISELVAIQAYKYDNSRFCIDYYMKSTIVDTWYSYFDDWKAILDKLDKFSLV